MRVAVLGSKGKVGATMVQAVNDAVAAGGIDPRDQLEIVGGVDHPAHLCAHPSGGAEHADADVAGTQTSLIFEHLRGASPL